MALHDFRVAVRRLRTLIRVYRDYFGTSIRKRYRRSLRKLSRKSSARRDRHAQLELLNGLPEGGWTAALAAVRPLLEEEANPGNDVERRLQKKFRKLDRRLRRRLERYEERLGLENLRDILTYRAVAVRRAGVLADELSSALADVRSRFDETELHQSRLAAKRLRYTLEPLEQSSSAIADAVGALRRLQDLVGETRDLALLRDVVLRARLDAEPSLAGEFDELAHALVERAVANYEELERVWLDGNSASFFQALWQALSTISPLAAVQSNLRPDPRSAQNPSRAPSSA